MAVFTALRNKAGQVAAGLAGSAIKSTLGLNRAPGALGSSADAGPKPRNPANVDYMQYPSDLSHESNSHFVLFTVKTFEGKKFFGILWPFEMWNEHNPQEHKNMFKLSHSIKKDVKLNSRPSVFHGQEMF